MSFLTPAAFVWLFTVPLLLLLYFMKLRRKVVQVPAVFLWAEAARQARVDSFFQRLRVNLLLLLQLLALLALIAALARPYRWSAGESAESLVIVIDVSASMQAQERFERAREAAQKLVKKAPGKAEFMLVAAGDNPRIIQPFSRDRAQLQKALEQLAPLDVAGDLLTLKPLLASLLAGRAQAEVFLFGDQLPEVLAHPRLRFIGFGQQEDNLGIASFSLNQPEDSDKLQVFAAVKSYAQTVQERELTLYRGGSVVHRRQLLLPAGERRTMLLEVPLSGEGRFELNLAPADALKVDDRAFAVAPRQKTLRVGMVGRNRFIEKALLATGETRVFASDGHTQGFDVLVLTEPDLATVDTASRLIFGTPNAWKNGEPGVQTTLKASEHPLVEGLPWSQVTVVGLVPLKLPPDSQVLVEGGDLPALVLHRDSLVFCFDLYRSDMALSPLFPILISRWLETQVQRHAGGLPEQLQTGQPVRWRSESPVNLRLPGGAEQRLEPRAGELFYPLLDKAGFYTVATANDSFELAANMFSESESTLLAPSEDPNLKQAGGTGERSAQTASLVEEYWAELAALALLLLLLEWVLYHRRGIA